MSWPVYDGGIASGLLFGVLFGYVLEGAGFGSPRKLVSQFTLRDWAVFKVMMTAVVVAAAGLYLFQSAGVIKPNAVFVPTLYLWATALGGILIGAGFALGGYCPGTSAAGLGSGRIDALAFIVGMVVGVWLFAGLFDDLEPFYYAAKGRPGLTTGQWLGVSEGVIIVAMAIMATAGFAAGGYFERKRGGPVTVEMLSGGKP